MPARWANTARSPSVSGHIIGRTNTLPLQVEQLYQNANTAGAFAVASLLAMLASITLAVKTISNGEQHREFELAQQATLAEVATQCFWPAQNLNECQHRTKQRQQEFRRCHRRSVRQLFRPGR